MSKHTSQAADRLDDYLRSTHDAQLTERGHKMTRGAVVVAEVGALALVAGLAVGSIPHELGRGVDKVHSDNLTTMVEEGVEKTGVENVDPSAIDEAAQKLDNYAPEYFQPGHTVEYVVTQTGLQRVFGNETVVVTNLAREGHHG